MAEPTQDLPGDLKPGTIIANNYRVLTRFGAGGMGTVYLGENITLDQKVVIKVLRVGGRGAGAEEAKLLAALDHPNVVHVYAYDEKWDCIVMQHLKGRSLQAVMEDNETRLDLIASLRIAAQTAQALQAVHERGVVHRDVKPDNVMLDFTGGEVKWVKVIDLGTALTVGRTIAQPAGTPEFCPPEQFDGSIGAATANDIYALGVTIFLLCTHRFPFDGEPMEIAMMHRDSEVPDLLDAVEAARKSHGLEPLDPQMSFVMEQVRDLVERMMSKDGKKRPTGRQVAHALTDLVDRFSSQSTQVGYRPPEPIPLTTLANKAKVSTMVLPKLDRPSTDKAIQEFKDTQGQGRGGNTKWIALAAVLLLLIAGGVVAMRPSGDPVEDAVVDAGAPTADVVVDAGVAPVVVAAEEKDSGTTVAVVAKDPEEELDPITKIKRKPDAGKKSVQIVLNAPSGCTWDDKFREYARRQKTDMKGMKGSDTPAFGKFVDAFDDAMVDKNCQKVNAALAAMRRVVGADE